MRPWRKSHCFLHNELCPTRPRFFEFSIPHSADNNWHLCKSHPIRAPTVSAESMFIIFILFENEQADGSNTWKRNITEHIFDVMNSRLMGTNRGSWGGGGGLMGRSPGQNFFVFMQFSGRIVQLVSWHPLRGWRSSLENPGSTTWISIRLFYNNHWENLYFME